MIQELASDYKWFLSKDAESQLTGLKGRTAIYFNSFEPERKRFIPKEITPKEIERISRLKPIAITTSDLMHLEPILKWTSGKGKLEKHADAILAYKYSSLFTTVKERILYRGIYLSVKGEELLEQGEVVRLKPRKITSWSTDLKVAKQFGNTLMKVPTDKVRVVFNCSQLEILLPDYVLSESEILVFKNGIEKIIQRNIL
jgi:hypothetical protein